MNSKRVWEVALTVLVAIFLLVAAEGRHPYGFYMVLRTAATVGGIYWAVRAVSYTHLDVYKRQRLQCAIFARGKQLGNRVKSREENQLPRRAWQLWRVIIDECRLCDGLSARLVNAGADRTHAPLKAQGKHRTKAEVHL